MSTLVTENRHGEPVILHAKRRVRTPDRATYVITTEGTWWRFPKKPPSKRDRHRAGVRARRRAV